MRRRLGWVVLAAVHLALAVLALRSGWAELRRARPGAQTSVYDPSSYYELVNREVAPYLDYCPVFPDPSSLAAAGGRTPAAEEGRDDARDEAPADATRQRAASPSTPDGGGIAATPARGGCACGERRLSPLFCLRAGAPVDRERIERYARMSSLLDDLAVRSRWHIGGDEGEHGTAGAAGVRLLPGEHRQHLPGGDLRPRYDGTIYYRQAASRVVLIDGGGNERVLGGPSPAAAATVRRPVPRTAAPPPKGGDPSFLASPGAPPEASMDRWLAEQERALTDGAPARSFYAGETLVLRHEHERVTLRVRSDGDSTFLLLIVDETRGDLTLSLDGAPLPSQKRRWILGLHPQQQLQLRWGSGPALTLRLVADRSSILSEMRYRVAGSERVYDERSGVEDYLRALVGALGDAAEKLGDGYRECGKEAESGAGRLPNIEPLARADLWLTLDQVLQGVAERGLGRYAEHGPPAERALGFRRGEWREGNPKDGDTLVPPPHLSLLVLDADGGDVLAAGAYPSTPVLRRLSADLARERGGPLAIAAEDLEAEEKRTSLHLRPHLIGSLFKPLFAWTAGEVNPALLDFTIPVDHAITWTPAPKGVKNRLLDQCLVSTRRDERTHEWHFDRAYTRPHFFASCDGRASGEEDLCLALAASDTYYFVELGARVMALARGLPLPPASTRAVDRDYQLSAACAPQRLDLGGHSSVTVCDGKSAPSAQRWFPVRCVRGDPNPFCGIADRLDIQLQKTADPRTPGSTRQFLGPLVGLVDDVARPLQGSCAELDTWRMGSESGFRWLVPFATEWPSDLMDSCAPDYEMFLEGARLNYWNNLHLAQALGRLFTGEPRLAARLVASVRVNGAESSPALAPAPSTEKAVSPVAEAREPVARYCEAHPATPRCRVLRGLSLAVEKGTLHRLAGLAKWLGETQLPGGKGHPEVSIWGKTGTSRDVYPEYVIEEAEGGARWVTDSTYRKTLNTALLVEVRQGDGRARHFVVQLWIEGVDDSFTAADGAVPFFARGQPGAELLRELVSYVAAEGT